VKGFPVIRRSNGGQGGNLRVGVRRKIGPFDLAHISNSATLLSAQENGKPTVVEHKT